MYVLVQQLYSILYSPYTAGFVLSIHICTVRVLPFLSGELPEHRVFGQEAW